MVLDKEAQPTAEAQQVFQFIDKAKRHIYNTLCDDFGQHFNRLVKETNDKLDEHAVWNRNEVVGAANQHNFQHADTVRGWIRHEIARARLEISNEIDEKVGKLRMEAQYEVEQLRVEILNNVENSKNLAEERRQATEHKFNNEVQLLRNEIETKLTNTRVENEKKLHGFVIDQCQINSDVDTNSKTQSESISNLYSECDKLKHRLGSLEDSQGQIGGMVQDVINAVDKLGSSGELNQQVDSQALNLRFATLRSELDKTRGEFTEHFRRVDDNAADTNKWVQS